MKRFEIGARVLACAALLASCGTTAATDRPVSLAVTNVTVIDPKTRTVQPQRSVYIDGDRILAVLPAGRRSGYLARQSIDGTGRFLIPGLMDMHVHLFLPQAPEASLNLMLANGVTSIREMSGDCWELAGARTGCISHFRALQSDIKAGRTPGPELVRVSSPMIMGSAVARAPEGAASFIVPRGAEDARKLVRHLHRRGVDLLKTHDAIPKPVFLALADEARQLGLEVSGHVPFGFNVAELGPLGFGSIEHARDLLYDCSRYGGDFRRAAGAFSEGAEGAKRPDDAVRMRRTVEEFDPDLCSVTLRGVARNGTYYVPTHVTREMDARASDPTYGSDPRRKYVLPTRNADWEADLKRTAGGGPQQAELYERFFRHGLEVTRRAHAAGVRIMAGTDANDTMIFPGFSLHDELRMLAAAGLSPMDVLRAATIVPASYLKRPDLGGISVGHEADLVLLSADPLRDITNSASIMAVIANGEVFDRPALDRLLFEAEEVARPRT